MYLQLKQSVYVVIMNVGAGRKDQVATWTTEAKKKQKIATMPWRLNIGVTLPPSCWKCEGCDKTDNLWLIKRLHVILMFFLPFSSYIMVIIHH